MAIVVFNSKEGIRVCEMPTQKKPKTGEEVELYGLKKSKVISVKSECTGNVTKATLAHDYGVLMGGNKSRVNGND